MADPWNILAQGQVNVPGLLGVYQNARQGRMQDMLLQRQLAKEDREAGRAERRKSYFSGPTPAEGGDPAISGAAASPGVAQAPTGIVPPSALPPRTDGASREWLGRVWQGVQAGDIDPEEYFKIQTGVFNGDAQAVKQYEQRSELIGRAAFDVESAIPQDDPAARMAYFRQYVAPELEARGVPVSGITPNDLTNAGLRRYQRLSQGAENLAKAREPIRSSPGDVFLGPDYKTVIGGSPEPRLVTGADGSIVPLYPSWNQGANNTPQGRPAVGEVVDDPRMGGASQTGSRTFP